VDIKKLVYFVTIVEEGNISAASKKLHIAQPPLSSQLKILEEELGIKLMERGSRNITLTEGGKLLYKRAKNIIELTETTKRELEDFENGEQGTFSLGTASSSGAILLSRRVIKFHKEYPKISFHIHEGNTYELLELLTAGIIEMAIVRTPFKMDKFNGIFLDEEPMIAVMRRELNFNGNEAKIKLKSLEDKPFIIYRRLKSLIVSSCNKEGFEPTIFCENDDARTTLMWAQAGLGIAIIPKSAFDIINDENMIYKVIDDKNLYTKIGAIWMKDRYLSSIAKSFIKVFKE
jgi:DNA-binding transcriptional LysR family regulator